jgi:apolipoprotein N-acyltransferase
MRNGFAMKERRPKRQREETGAAEKTAPQPMPEGRKTFYVALGCSLLGGLILWAAFPPLNLWLVAWLAPLPWVYLILRPQPITRWAYFGIWVGGFVHWLLMLQGIRLANIWLYFGWVLLAAYLAVYLPLFVGLCRVAAQGLRISAVLTVPVVWVGLELARGYIVTGFSAGLLSHTQTDWPALLQIADVFGAYGVSFVMMLVTAALGQVLCASRLFFGATPPSKLENGRSLDHDLATMFGPLAKYWHGPAAVLVLASTLAYGYLRLSENNPGKESDSLTVALIQGSRDVHVDLPEADAVERMDHYVNLTDQARREIPVLDLVIWPESMFRLPEVNLAEPYLVPSSGLQEIQEEFRVAIDERVKSLNSNTDSAEVPPTRFWFCTTSVILGDNRKRTFHNTAILVDENGQIISRYHKMHGVMFGEYVPFGGWFPGIYDFVPIEGMTEGNQAAAATVRGWTFCPSICFESTIPHLIRSQVLQLEKNGTRPDVLVNLTNDGWFYGSSILDLHLKCSVFRAIENRRPMLIAANTGISAHIDGSGRILQRAPKRRAQVLVATVQPDGRRPFYLLIGDLPALACTAFCGLLIGIGLLRKRGQ